jgi:hypothetical protein
MKTLATNQEIEIEILEDDGDKHTDRMVNHSWTAALLSRP